MTTAKHTPAPWRVIDANFHDGDPLADALLIAAAPELLEQLKHVVRGFDQLTPEDVARYRAVIARAEGKTA